MENQLQEVLVGDRISRSPFSIEYLHIPTVQEARQFFGPISIEERSWRGEKYFNELLTSARSRLGIGEHDRAEAFIFGNGAYPDGDKQAHKRHFPVSVKVISIDELFLTPGEVLDLSAHPDEFPWHIGEEEIYLHVTINKLNLCPQSKIVVRDNVLIFNCIEAIGHNMEECEAIIELGASSTQQHSVATRHAASTKSGYNGINGLDGRPLRHETTPIGLRVAEGSGLNKGQKGGDGEKGNSGPAGANGSMLLLSDLRFGHLEGFTNQSIKLKAGAAPGFNGGKGAIGGNGGNGGNGASGVATPFGITNGCEGGTGGHGGDGGNGGNGGNGGIACDVFVSVPYAAKNVFQAETFPSLGGKGGVGGEGGQAGKGGAHGKFHTTKYDSQYARPGQEGAKGKKGRDGKTRPAPHVHIYERLD